MDVMGLQSFLKRDFWTENSAKTSTLEPEERISDLRQLKGNLEKESLEKENLQKENLQKEYLEKENSENQESPWSEYFEKLDEKQKEKEVFLQEQQKEQEFRKQRMESEIQKKQKKVLLEESVLQKTEEDSKESSREYPLASAINKKKVSKIFGIRSEAVHLAGICQMADGLISGISILKSEQETDYAFGRKFGHEEKRTDSRKREMERLERKLLEAETETVKRYEALLKNIQAVQKMKMTNGEQEAEDARPKTLYEQIAARNQNQKLLRQSAVNRRFRGFQRAEQYGRLKVNVLF